MGLGLAVALLAGATPAACPIDRAVYRLHGAPRVEAGFATLAHPGMYSDLLFYVRTARRTYWFSFTSSLGYSLTYLQPSPSPRHFYDDVPARAPAAGEEAPTPQIVAFAADLRTIEAAPRSSSPPPAHLLVPTLGRDLWYDAVGLANGDRTAQQESIPTGMFSRAGCAPRPH